METMLFISRSHRASVRLPGGHQCAVAGNLALRVDHLDKVPHQDQSVGEASRYEPHLQHQHSSQLKRPWYTPKDMVQRGACRPSIWLRQPVDSRLLPVAKEQRMGKPLTGYFWVSCPKVPQVN